MAEKKTRAAARKIKDKWKSKVWYNLLAPEMFNRQLIGEGLPDELAVEHLGGEEVVPDLGLPLVLDLPRGRAGLLLRHAGPSKGRGIFKGSRSGVRRRRA